MEKILATTDDISLLRKEMEKKQNGQWLIILVSFLFSFFVIFVRKRGSSIYDDYGFIGPFSIFFPILSALLYLSNLKEKRKFEKDLHIGFKIIEIIKIIDKDTNMKNECLITLDIQNPKLIKQKIE